MPCLFWSGMEPGKHPVGYSPVRHRPVFIQRPAFCWANASFFSCLASFALQCRVISPSEPGVPVGASGYPWTLSAAVAHAPVQQKPGAESTQRRRLENASITNDPNRRDGRLAGRLAGRVNGQSLPPDECSRSDRVAIYWTPRPRRPVPPAAPPRRAARRRHSDRQPEITSKLPHSNDIQLANYSRRRSLVPSPRRGPTRPDVLTGPQPFPLRKKE